MSTLKALALFSGLFVAAGAVAQGFPQSMKQPKPVEMKRNQRKFKMQGKRHHHNINRDGILPRRRPSPESQHLHGQG